MKYIVETKSGRAKLTTYDKEKADKKCNKEEGDSIIYKYD